MDENNTNISSDLLTDLEAVNSALRHLRIARDTIDVNKDNGLNENTLNRLVIKNRIDIEIQSIKNMFPEAD